MYKNFAVLLSFLSLSVRAHANVDNLVSAIEGADVEEVKYLVNENAPFTQDEKDELLNIAKEIAQKKKEKTESIFYSEHDMARLCLGIVLLPIGGGLGVYSAVTLAGSMIFPPGLVVSVPLSVCTYYILKTSFDQIGKGWNLYSAHEKLRLAREIQKIIQNAKVQAAARKK